ncbi:uncharacterized protein LOC144097749 [Amblyomma americanum]
MGELSVLPSVMMRSMMRSGLSRIIDDSGGPEGNPMHFCTLCTVCVLILAVFSYGVYYAFIKDKGPSHIDVEKTTTTISYETCNNLTWTPTTEEPPLLCSFDGSKQYDYPVHMCSYIIFLSATVDKAKLTAAPVAGTNQRFEQFKAMTKNGGVKKLLSFRYDDISSLTSNELDRAFASARDSVFHGIDVRYTQGEEHWLKVLSEIRQLADKNGYLIHVVFDKPNKVELSLVHIASLRVYTSLSQGPYTASAIQPKTKIEKTVEEYTAALGGSGSQIAMSAWHCIAFSLAAVSFKASEYFGDLAVGIAKLEYCEFKRENAEKADNDESYFVKSSTSSIVVFEKEKEFGEKVKMVTKLTKPCVLLDDVYYDYHDCRCDNKNFKLLRATRRVLWGSTVSRP